MRHCSLQVEVGYLNMQTVFKKAQRKRIVELLLSLIRYRDFHFPAQGGIQSGARVNTLLSTFGSTQEVTDWGEFGSSCRRVGGFQFGSQRGSAAQKTSSAKICKFRKVVNVKKYDNPVLE